MEPLSWNCCRMVSMLGEIETGQECLCLCATSLVLPGGISLFFFPLAVVYSPVWLVSLNGTQISPEKNTLRKDAQNKRRRKREDDERTRRRRRRCAKYREPDWLVWKVQSKGVSSGQRRGHNSDITMQYSTHWASAHTPRLQYEYKLVCICTQVLSRRAIRNKCFSNLKDKARNEDRNTDRSRY